MSSSNRGTILFLSKRRPQGKDLLTQPYGRFFNIPKELAKKNYNCHLLLADYNHSKSESTTIDGVRIHSVSLRNPFQYLKETIAYGKNIQPSWVVGFSDIHYGILAKTLSNNLRCPYVIDAYDNYESYIPWALPLHFAWRQTLKHSSGITAAGPHLLEKMTSRGTCSNTAIVPMAADPNFFPIEKTEARQKIGLDPKAQIIGYFGSISANRGINYLFDVFHEIIKTKPNTLLVLSGRKDKNLSIPQKCTYMGYIEDSLLPSLINAVDLTVALNLNSSFGRYSYPVKLYESIACDTPALSIPTEPAKWILDDNQSLLIPPHDRKKGADKIIKALDSPPKLNPRDRSWYQSASIFEDILAKATTKPI